MDATFLFGWFINSRKSLLQSSVHDSEEKTFISKFLYCFKTRWCELCH